MEQYQISDFASEADACIKQLAAAIALLKPFREYYKRRGTSSVAIALQALSKHRRVVGNDQIPAFMLLVESTESDVISKINASEFEEALDILL